MCWSNIRWYRLRKPNALLFYFSRKQSNDHNRHFIYSRSKSNKGTTTTEREQILRVHPYQWQIEMERKIENQRKKTSPWNGNIHNGTTQFISVFCLCVRCACIYRQLWTSTKNKNAKNDAKTLRLAVPDAYSIFALASVGARSQHNM